MAFTTEPTIQRGAKPERVLEDAVIAEVKVILNKQKEENRLEEFFILRAFGLDVAIFLKWNNHSTIRFLELKTFVGSRQGGIGFGNKTGDGPQVDLLLLTDSQLALADRHIAWILLDGTKPYGSKRFAFFDNRRAKKAAMGGVSKGKQNNLKTKSLIAEPITWCELSESLLSFLAPGTWDFGTKGKSGL